MRYVLLICQDETTITGTDPDRYAAFMAFQDEMTERGVLGPGFRLHPTTSATTVRVRDHELVIGDGPFAETKEQIAGLYVIDCQDLDEAIEIAAKVPSRPVGHHRVAPGVGGVSDPEVAVAQAFQSEWGRVLAHLIRVTGDWDLAEDCAQEAFARALERWPRDGVPANPAGWLKTTARNRALDRLRRASVGASKLQEVATMQQPNDPIAQLELEEDISDDRLRLMFTACHPALPVEAQVALTLRTLAGLTTAEIARAFLVSEETMAKRLVRAKGKIREAAIPFRVPAGHALPARTRAVEAVLYGLFNQGYAATTGPELVRADLCAEAIRLTRLLTELMPDEPEALGLLALMMLHHARRHGRVDEAGDLVTLEDQDRSLWDTDAIAEAEVVLDRAIRLRRPGPYQLMAAIAACHATAPSAAETDWHEIAALYDRLVELVPTPVVRLNRVVAVAMTEGPAAGLAPLDELEDEGALEGYYLLAATRGDLLDRLGRRDEAGAQYRRAIDLAPSDPERRYLAKRLAATEPAP